MTDGGFRSDGTFVPWPAHDTARLTEAFRCPVLRLLVRVALFDEDQAAEILTSPHSASHVHAAVWVPEDDRAFVTRPACPSCDGVMRSFAYITRASVIDQIVAHLRTRASHTARASAESPLDPGTGRAGRPATIVGCTRGPLSLTPIPRPAHRRKARASVPPGPPSDPRGHRDPLSDRGPDGPRGAPAERRACRRPSGCLPRSMIALKTRPTSIEGPIPQNFLRGDGYSANTRHLRPEER